MILQDLNHSDEEMKIINSVIKEENDKIDVVMTGICHVVWKNAKKRLKEEYNIDWKTPKEMNPHIMFD